MSWYEDFLLTNAEAFVSGGIRAIKIQDETREEGGASPRTVARMSALGRVFRQAYPDVVLGIIVQAHDAISPLSIADASGADFVRLKVFVGTSVNAEGMRNALSVQATSYREAIDRSDIAILADVHDRTSIALSPVDDAAAADWAQKAGADAIVLTGSSFGDSCHRVKQARDAGVACPILIGGGITEANISEGLSLADGVVVSTALMRGDAAAEDLLRWDAQAIRRLMDRVSGN